MIELHWGQILAYGFFLVVIWECVSRIAHNRVNKDNSRILSTREAREIINAHGFEPYLYLPTIGFDQNERLFNALDSLKSRGYVVMDKERRLVGKVVSFTESEPEGRTLN